MKNMYFFTNSLAVNYFDNNAIKICNRGVYRLDDDKVIKKVNEERSKKVYEEFSISNLLQFKNIDIEGFSFARALVYTGLLEVYAIITKYVEGRDVFDKSLNCYKIDNVINAVNKLERAIRKLSDYGIYANDVNYGNIIFDGNNITIIDTIEYYFDDVDPSYIYKENMQNVMDTIFKNIFYKNGYRNEFATVNSLYRYFRLRKSEFEHFCEIEYLMNPVETLIAIRKFMEEDFGVRLETFGECHAHISKVIENGFNTKMRVIKK